jgi:drug/metabolite transporter (DMT)-like permease
MENTIRLEAQRISDESKGMWLGLAGVAVFSLTLPFTRMAVAQLDPVFVALGRALVASILAAAWLWWNDAPLPRASQLGSLALVALGCVVGFPLFTSIALQTVPAAHGAVLVGILPLATALCAALRGHERPSFGFWVMALLGSAIVVGFALRKGGGVFHWTDVAIFVAVALAALGYAEGGRLAQRMGGQQVICWALVLSAPLLLPVVLWLGWAHGTAIAAAGFKAWLGFAYISLFSMFIGFFFWYKGLALGGIARVGQVQLLQPLLTLLGASVLLGEPLELVNILFAVLIIAVVAFGRRMAIRR